MASSKTALYARVSRDDLHCENQEKILKEWASRNGITNYEYFFEEISSRKTRPVKERVLLGFRNGEYGTIVVVRIDRFARSLQELIMDIRSVVESGGRFVAIQNSFDFHKGTFNASQQLMLSIFGAFAEFEREIIRERTIEGLARVKAQGKVLGRPRKTPPVKPEPVSPAKSMPI
jgi:DNA invertase Pin-like site-specific DNA recombinase